MSINKEMIDSATLLQRKREAKEMKINCMVNGVVKSLEKDL